MCLQVQMILVIQIDNLLNLGAKLAPMISRIHDHNLLNLGVAKTPLFWNKICQKF